MLSKKLISEISLKLHNTRSRFYRTREGEEDHGKLDNCNQKEDLWKGRIQRWLFAKIQTCGIDGVEKDILLCTIQVHREEMTLSKEQFQQELRVGRVLDITTTMELRHLEANCV